MSERMSAWPRSQSRRRRRCRHRSTSEAVSTPAPNRRRALLKSNIGSHAPASSRRGCSVAIGHRELPCRFVAAHRRRSDAARRRYRGDRSALDAITGAGGLGPITVAISNPPSDRPRSTLSRSQSPPVPLSPNAAPSPNNRRSSPLSLSPVPPTGPATVKCSPRPEVDPFV
jgi:hypothetical protein